MNWRKSKPIFVLILQCICITGSIAGYYQWNNTKHPGDCIVEVLEVDTGRYGYKIIQHGQTVIMQPFVPGVCGKYSFTSPDDARKVGQLVRKRLLAGEDFSITSNDLERLKIPPFIESR